MAGESSNGRARARRARAANVAGGRSNRCVVMLSDSEYADLKGRAAEAGMSVQRLLVETTLGKTVAGSSGPDRTAAVLQVLDLDEQIRREGNNLNQLVKYSHQDKRLVEGVPLAVAAGVRTSLTVVALARWVMGMAPAVSPSVIAEERLEAAEDWAARVDDGVPDLDDAQG